MHVSGEEENHALCDENVVHSEDVDLIDALGLESIVVLDIAGNLGVASASEGTWDTDLQNHRLASLANAAM